MENNEPIATENKPVVRKKERTSLHNMVFAQDFKDIKSGIVKNVIEPKIKDLAYSVVDSFLNTIKASAQMMIFKEIRPDTQNGYRVDTYSYNTGYNYNAVSNQQNKGYLRYDQVTFSDYLTAERLKKKLDAIFEKYHRLRISDVYAELRDIAPRAKGDFTNQNYGWTNIDDMKIVNDSTGWFISYPPPVYIG